ncbi:hypothetical protein SCP_0509360 [Sparassis crispa]|uniref:Large ribosomal subunit protein mL59 domain-containing protein n=1 Tax=Sparassis crispa TaxID=139825 RepID=A0A401GP05_9APHY|nr:hypothetical protein SCP_0509360 [Sparassis crispa]GBE83879.1 hypothetical protein SCP_0509360 [Sparassis crispa]
MLQAIKRFRIRELSALPKIDALTANSSLKIRNPFLPHKNPDTGRWAPPKYSLRRQAELIKKARASNTLNLLPPGLKFGVDEVIEAKEVKVAKPEVLARSEFWKYELEWEGKLKQKEVPGQDVGNKLYAGKRRMFKGHKWERTREQREEKRKMLMKGMAKRIERFKTTYRRKRPSPISVPRHTNYTRLPF